MKSSYLAFVALFTSTLCLAAPLDGAGLYQNNCAQCHGERGTGGTVGMGNMTPGASGTTAGKGMMNGMSGKGGSEMMGLKAPKLVGDASAWKPELFERAVLQGIDDEGQPLNRVMPHWGSSSFTSDHGTAPTKEEVDAIQHYLQAQK